MRAAESQEENIHLRANTIVLRVDTYAAKNVTRKSSAIIDVTENLEIAEMH